MVETAQTEHPSLPADHDPGRCYVRLVCPIGIGLRDVVTFMSQSLRTYWDNEIRQLLAKICALKSHLSARGSARFGAEFRVGRFLI